MAASPKRYSRFETPALGENRSERNDTPLQPIVPGNLRPSDTASTEPEREPTVRVIREDGRIRSIEIDCSCGRPIRIECEYEPQGSLAPASEDGAEGPRGNPANEGQETS